jgi:hypothetical protein
VTRQHTKSWQFAIWRLRAEHREGVKRIDRLGHYFRSGNSSVRGVFVNLVPCNLPVDELNSVAAAQLQYPAQPGPRIERCEFEQLLQRAMEILNARDLKAQLATTASASAV